MTAAADRDFERFRRAGDAAALAAVFDQVAPRLLLLASHWTRDPATAEDLVQIVFVQALRDAEQWDARQPVGRWLAGILAHRALDLQKRTARHPHQPFADAPGREASPLAAAIDKEALDGIHAAIERLDAPYRDVLVLRLLHGIEPAAIAHALGRPPATVRKQLERGLQRLRAALPASIAVLLAGLIASARGHAAVRAAVLGSGNLAVTPASVAAAAATVWIVTMKKLLAAMLVLGVVTWCVWPRAAVPAPSATHEGANGVVANAARDMAADASGVVQAEPAREAAPVVPPANAPSAALPTGSLRVRVRYEQEPVAGSGVLVALQPLGADPRMHVRHAHTDAAGDARFEAIAPGAVRVWATASPRPVEAEVVAGEEIGCDIRLANGVTLHGIVVDPDGAPVAGAIVEGAFGGGRATIDADQIAISGADGMFVVRECHRIGLVGARAEGFAASQLYSLFALAPSGRLEPSELHLRIELMRDGGIVEGVVLGPDAAPVAGAVVRVGEGRTDRIMSTPQGAPPLPAQVRTDADGRFRAIGVPAGVQPVQARAAALAPWLGACEVPPGRTAVVRVELTRAMTVAGRVVDESGRPVVGAEVVSREASDADPFPLQRGWQRGDFVSYRAVTAADGTFRLAGVPPTGVTLIAAKESLGRAEAEVRGEAGATVACELVLSNGLVLRGRVFVDDEPRKGLLVEIRSEGAQSGWMSTGATAADGAFAIPYCPAGRTFRVLVRAKGCVPFEQGGFVVKEQPHEIRLVTDTASKARITGRLLRADGSPAVGESVDANLASPRQSAGAAVAADGSFVLEVFAGAWSLRVLVTGSPEIRVPAKALQPGELWDVGTLQLTIGGTLVVTEAAGDARLDYLVVDAAERFVCGLHSPTPPLHSDPLAPGEYTLLVRATGVAAQALPFTIRSDATTELAVSRPPGVRQQLEFVPAAGSEPTRVSFRIRRGGRLVHWASATGEAGRFQHTVWLVPGDYELAQADGAATVAFTVGAQEGEPVRLALR